MRDSSDTPTTEPDPLIGREIHHLRIVERIGQGGTGSIFLAEDTRLEGRLCALKEVEYDRALPPNVLEQSLYLGGNVYVYEGGFVTKLLRQLFTV